MVKTGSQRVREHREGVKAHGGRPVYVMFSKEAKERLSRLCEQRRKTQAEVLDAALILLEASREESGATVIHGVLNYDWRQKLEFENE